MRMLFMLKLFYFLILFVAISVLYWLFYEPKEDFNFDYFDNQEGHFFPIIPNLVHYVVFDLVSIDFTTFLSMTSVIKIQQPDHLWIHCNQIIEENHYYSLIKALANLTKTKVSLHQFNPPTHVFGQPLSSVYHRSDVARIAILSEHGGIYLDTDMLVLKPLDKFLHYEMVVAWPYNDYLGNQILIGHKEARFLKLWLQGYRVYKPRMWYYNAGQFPTEQILLKVPNVAHREPEKLGVHNLINELYERNDWDWSDYYAIHLLSRHPPAPVLNEKTLDKYNMTFGAIARWLLFKVAPSLDITSIPTKWYS